MKRIIYAKLLCLITVFLLGGNLVYSSLNVSAELGVKDDHKVKLTLIEDSTEDLVFSEIELEEEEEADTFYDITPYLYFSPRTVEHIKTFKQYSYNYKISSIPRWLMIRHILI